MVQNKKHLELFSCHDFRIQYSDDFSIHLSNIITLFFIAPQTFFERFIAPQLIIKFKSYHMVIL